MQSYEITRIICKKILGTIMNTAMMTQQLGFVQACLQHHLFALKKSMLVCTMLYKAQYILSHLISILLMLKLL